MNCTSNPTAYYIGKSLAFVENAKDGIDYVLDNHWFMYLGIRTRPANKIVLFTLTKDLKKALEEAHVAL